MAEVAALGLRVDGVAGVEKAASSLDNLGRSGSSAEKAVDGLNKKNDQGKKSVEGFGQSTLSASQNIDRLGAAAFKAGAFIGAAFSISKLRGYADSWSDLQSQVGAATQDMAGAADQMQRLVDVANASYSPLEQTVAGFTNNLTALQDMGRSASDAADYTESLNHMLVLTATRGERAASVQNALSKAMAVGKLQAMGLETVLANGGEVASALAAELGTTVSGLRGLAAQGKITSEVIANAIIKPLDTVRERAALLPPTIGDAMTRVNTNMTYLVGSLDKATGASSAVAGAFIRVADGLAAITKNKDALDAIIKTAEVLGIAIGARLAAAALAAAGSFGMAQLSAARLQVTTLQLTGSSVSAAAGMTALAVATRAASGAMALLGGPLGVGIALLGGAAYAWSKYGQSAM